jgi:hypothetical protein
MPNGLLKIAKNFAVYAVEIFYRLSDRFRREVREGGSR